MVKRHRRKMLQALCFKLVHFSAVSLLMEIFCQKPVPSPTPLYLSFFLISTLHIRRFRY